jgi:Leucine-rich repeat (LRR) protein
MINMSRNEPMRPFRPRPWLALTFAVALLTSISGCRCGGEEPSDSAVVEPEPSQPVTLETKTRTQTLRKLVIADASMLASVDLSTIEFLDLAMSERDSQERPLQLRAETGETETGTGDLDAAGDTGDTGGAGEVALAPTPELSSPRCEGLDLHVLAERAPQLVALRISGCQAAVHAGLSAFGERLLELELVDLELDAVTVARLSQLHGLESLTLTRVHAEPDALKPLGRKISPRVVVLRELEPDSAVSELFRILGDIEEIRLIGPWVAHNTMIRVGKARKLERLAVIDTEIGNFSLHQIKTLEHLRRIEWSGSGFNNGSPIVLRELPLDELICNCPRLGDKGLHQLNLLAGLRTLVLERSDVSSAGLIELAGLSALTDLTIRYRNIDGEGFKALATLPLQRLVLGPGKLDDPKATGLGDLTSLRELDIQLEGFGDAAAPQLASLVALERLGLGNSEISDEGLTHLAPLTRMRHLELQHTRVTKHGLVHLQGMQALELLELDHTDVVDEGVAHLVKLSALEELRLDHTLITDAAIPYLLQLTNLERLNLAETVITSTGAATLDQLPRLNAVNLAGTRAMP